MARSGTILDPTVPEGPLSRSRDREFLVRIILPALLILAIAGVPRLFMPGTTFMPNGIDEGIDMMSGRMVFSGYEIYSEVNTVQGPIMITIYGLLDMPVEFFRVLSALASLFVIAFVMYISYRVGGRNAMIAAGAFSAMDLLLMQQSRLASLDIFTLFLVVAGLTLFILHRDSGNRILLAGSGVILSFSIMTKLFGIIAAGAIIALMLFEIVFRYRPFKRYRLNRYLPEGGRSPSTITDLLVFTFAMVGMTVIIMSIFGITNVIEGIFLNQLHRPSDPLIVKFGYYGVFALCNLIAIPFFFFGAIPLYRKREGSILLIGLAYAIFFLAMGKVWIHHLVFLSPFLSITAGIGLSRAIMKIKTTRHGNRVSPTHSIRSTLACMILLTAFLGGTVALVVQHQGMPRDSNDSQAVHRLSEEGDYIISGDPMITLMADRLQPPGLINLAFVQYPPVTDDQLNDTAIAFAVVVVVITYRLLDMEGFREFVEGNYTLRASFTCDSPTLGREYENRYIYALASDSPLRDDPRWGSSLRIEPGNGPSQAFPA